MNVPANKKEFLTASDVAKFCQVDLKTIHNWCDKGQIEHFRTPGRHIRFKPTHVATFLQKYGYPVPEELASEGAPRVMILSSNKDDLAHFHDHFSGEFAFSLCGDPLVGVARALGAGGPVADALIIIPPFAQFTCDNIPQRLAKAGHNIPCFGYYQKELASVAILGGAHFIGFYGDLKTMGDALRRVLNRT